MLSESFQTNPEEFELVELFQSLSILCSRMTKKVVLMIDEVDSATNKRMSLHRKFMITRKGIQILSDT